MVLTAHAKLSKFEQPDELGSYDRWELKLSKYILPMVKEWADLILFANYKTFAVASDESGKKFKAQGGKRVMYTTHHPCWDAKNRFGLPDECPFEYSVIAPHIWTPQGRMTSKIPAAPQPTTSVQPAPQAPVPPAPKTDPLYAVEQTAQQMGIPVTHNPQQSPRDELIAHGIPDALADLMVPKGVTEQELRSVVANRGYFPADMPVKDYPKDFVDACLIGAWDQVYKMICDMRDNNDLPF